MSFHKTACDVHLNAHAGATCLVATCNNDEGTGLETELDLDEYLGNEDGKLFLKFELYLLFRAMQKSPGLSFSD